MNANDWWKWNTKRVKSSLDSQNNLSPETEILLKSGDSNVAPFALVLRGDYDRIKNLPTKLGIVKEIKS